MHRFYYGHENGGFERVSFPRMKEGRSDAATKGTPGLAHLTTTTGPGGPEGAEDERRD